MKRNLIEKIQEVNKNPDLWDAASNEMLKDGIILIYNFERKQAFATVDLRARIIDRLEHLHLSQTELARLVGSDQRYISRYLHGGTLSDKIKERIIGTLNLLKPLQ